MTGKRCVPWMLGLVAGALLISTPAQATFPGDNGLIAFASNRTGNIEIYTMKPNGRDVRQLTNSPRADLLPRWSADGSKIVFARKRVIGNREIFVMNADGSGQTRITNDPAFDTWPEWSPDGTKIMFSSNRGRGFIQCPGADFTIPATALYVMSADGSGVTKVADTPFIQIAGRWSPDGERIVFQGSPPNSCTPAIYTMKADGSDLRKLTPDSLNGTEPDWSPDGTRIVFNDDQCPTCAFGVSDVMVMNADGTDLRRLTPENAFGDNVGVTFSPNGDRITFANFDATGFGDVWVMSADGTGLRNLTANGPIFDFEPAWQPRVGEDAGSGTSAGS
jgi:TolB protein